MEMDPRHWGQMYFDRVMQNYENKAPDYEEKLQIRHQPVSARGRKTYRKKHRPTMLHSEVEENINQAHCPTITTVAQLH